MNLAKELRDLKDQVSKWEERFAALEDRVANPPPRKGIHDDLVDKLGSLKVNETHFHACPFEQQTKIVAVNSTASRRHDMKFRTLTTEDGVIFVRIQ